MLPEIHCHRYTYRYHQVHCVPGLLLGDNNRKWHNCRPNCSLRNFLSND